MSRPLAPGAVLVVAEDRDATADLVVRELERRERPVMRFDLADFPAHLALSIDHGGSPWRGVLEDGLRRVRVEEVGAVYYRRPRPPAGPELLDEPYRTWAGQQALSGLLGALYALPASVVWLNRPDVDAIAAHKPGQLPVAAQYGLHTPRTLITNDPAMAREWCAELGAPVVCKPLSGGPLDHGDGRRQAVPTHLIDPAELDDTVKLTAHLFQEWVPKAYEVRLTVVGRRCMATEIHAGSDAAYEDWRTDYDALTYKPCDVPARVRAGVLAWLDHFGLSYGAFDFAVTDSGRWTFLECNPSGQWGWIEARAGLPITAAITDFLTRSKL
ncbi:ATP-grasp ribosomal peptide maturase [Streptomyces sp. DSM 42041]|uniref:ATP-grasp ribosomal peptide maturase n=1 Tax=Streptomyces hazeniae TaxID=3075538 RepID=A0ABU2NN46_9ACTN|nr:ATP-grasp ribosomal peptide maturase [Streptomyces sp. DSM 42041]MDT0378404.1 ATP-grasp ribosomal peptide maturase [Streptomyces sp. DSM 42041]